MAVAPLSRVRVRSDLEGLGALVGALIGFGRFHPSRREGLVQDIRLVLWASRAQGVYGRAHEILRRPELQAVPPGGPIDYEVGDVGQFLVDLEDDVAFIERNLPLAPSPEDRRALVVLLRSIRDVALGLFNDLNRLLVVPGSEEAVTIEGFVPTSRAPAFAQAVGSHLVLSEPVLRRGADDPYVPTLLVNPRAIALFERITLDRGIPRYSEIDPTPIVALVFPLFFGIMFGDLGHGFALLGAGLYLAYRTRFVYWGHLIAAFGVSAALVGLLRGVFFGVTFASPVSRFVTLPPAFSAEATFSYLPLLLEAALVVGTLHLASAYAIAVANAGRSRRYEEVAVNALPTLLLYAALVPFGFAVLGAGLRPWAVFSVTAPTPFFTGFLGVAIPVADTAYVTVPVILGAFLALVFGGALWAVVGRHGKAVVPALRAGLHRSVTRPLEFVLNTLSYVRLAALLVANTLLTGLIARFLVLGWAGVVVAALLNLPLMAMEGLIVYLQDMRLHWMEWLSKFYAGTGTAFDPLSLESRAFRVAWVAAPAA